MLKKNPPIGIGLIGVGRHGRRYASHILQDVPAAVLRAICRRRPDQNLDLPGAESVHVYGQIRSLIEDPSVEAVISVTPPILSPEICRLAVQARKPLLIEKPLAVTAAEARAMVSAARQAGVPLMTAQTLRFDAAIQEMRSRRGAIGRSERMVFTSHVETKETAPGHAEGYGKRGALLEIGVHLLDAIRFLTGDEIRDVRCTMNRIPPIEQETAVFAELTTEGGTRCFLDVARVQEQRVGVVEWIGSNGCLWADWPHRLVRWRSKAGENSVSELPPSRTVLATIGAFLQALEHGTPMPITGEDGCRAVEIAEACYRSAAAGGVLVTMPPDGATAYGTHPLHAS